MIASAAQPTSSPVEREVHRIRDLVAARHYGQALAAGRALALSVPDNRDVLYLVAVSERYLQRISDALTTLTRLEALHPAYSRLYQERGHCHVFLKDASRAIEAFLKGVGLNPALSASWSMLEGLYRLIGDISNADWATAHVTALKQLPPDIVTAMAFFSDGELVLADQLVRVHLQRHPDAVEALHLLGRIALQRDGVGDAETLFARVLEISPGYEAARVDYAHALLERHKHARAAEELALLMRKDPANRHYKLSYAAAIVGLGEHEKAAQVYRELLVETPAAAELHLSLGHSFKTLGRRQEAVDAYQAAAAARSGYGDAYWSLANLKTHRFSDAELVQMYAAADAPDARLADRYQLCFALGKALEDRGEYETSWRHYERGNALKRSESHYRPEVVELNTRRQVAVCTRDFFELRAGVGDRRADPIFIVGLPRSGSTLIEHILASHSRVEGTQELADIPRMVSELQGRESDRDEPRYPGVLAELPPEEFLRLGSSYLRDSQEYRSKPGAVRFIDKMPNNFRHVGLIHLILPNAIIIDARRDPLACCFSNLKQLFATGQEFTYSVPDIARYYLTYVELMRHWDEVLPGRVLRVSYEGVVEDLEGSVRRILDFCGLGFEPACVDFHKTTRSVRTASSEQVRQPLFRDGLTQWMHFEPWLGPLRQALGEALEPGLPASGKLRAAFP